MRLLLVDDEMLAIDGLKENLLSMPYSFEEIYTANSKSKAQVILEQHKIDMIFCDIEMPNGNGLELLAWVSAPKCVRRTTSLSRIGYGFPITARTATPAFTRAPRTPCI